MVMEDEHNNDNNLSDPKDQESELKRNNTKRRPLNRACLRNHFEVGRNSLKNIVKERGIERAKYERKVKLIYDSVKHFRKYQQQEMTNLDERGNSMEIDVEEKTWEQNIHSTLCSFDKDSYSRHD